MISEAKGTVKLLVRDPESILTFKTKNSAQLMIILLVDYILQEGKDQEMISNMNSKSENKKQSLG